MGHRDRYSGRMLALKTLTGQAIAGHIPDLARLRIAVFRDWPYLYDGDESYERDYLSVFSRSPGAVVILALDGDAVVGASTGMPLESEQDFIRAPFAAAGIDQRPIFYFSESVLLKPYRGQGLGGAFFRAREEFARQDYDWAYFCAVIRHHGHPAQPAGYVPLDDFWRRRGYEPVPDLIAHFSWKDVGDSKETEKPMLFWRKRLRS